MKSITFLKKEGAAAQDKEVDAIERSVINVAKGVVTKPNVQGCDATPEKTASAATFSKEIENLATQYEQVEAFTP